MTDFDTNDLSTSLSTELNAPLPTGALTEDDLVFWLAQHIGELLQHRTEYLFSVFYCLDVDEAKMHNALLPDAPDPADIGLAKLLIARQRQRIFTKKIYKQPKLREEDGGW